MHLLVTHLYFRCLQNGYDDAKQADSAAKDLHNEDLHEEVGVLGVGQSGSAAHDANADATEEVGEADSQTGSEHGVTSLVVPGPDGLGGCSTEVLCHVADYNGHDDAVDRHCFTEDDANQILGFDSWSLDSTTKDARASDVDPPGCSHHRQRDGQANAQIGPHERWGLQQEPCYVEAETEVKYGVAETDD